MFYPDEFYKNLDKKRIDFLKQYNENLKNAAIYVQNVINSLKIDENLQKSILFMAKTLNSIEKEENKHEQK